MAYYNGKCDPPLPTSPRPLGSDVIANVTSVMYPMYLLYVFSLIHMCHFLPVPRSMSPWMHDVKFIVNKFLYPRTAYMHLSDVPVPHCAVV